MTNRRLGTVALALAACAPPACAATPVSLEHDPFRRFELPAPARTATAAATRVPGAPEPAAVWRPRLRGLVVAGPASIANVEGTLVPIGGELDGYRLEAVDHERARFRKGRETVELRLEGVHEVRP